MITLLPNLPDNTVGLAASGRVTGGDYEEVLVPAVEAALKKHKKLRLIYELGSDFTGFAAGAVWDDMKLGMAHLSAWERVAVVTDVGWVANATNIFKFVMPCTVKVFSLKDRVKAEKWIAV
ncbi:MAG: STAS/SEC14 domain-containing protein [Betaproteobacteria bacterium]